MSQRAASTDPFVPFDPIFSSAPKPGVPVGLKVVSQAEAVPAFAPLHSPVSSHAHSSKSAASTPVVTLQREGELVTGIRIECVCGQVIELACAY